MYKYWQWYDRLREPKRFLVAMAMLSPFWWTPFLLKSHPFVAMLGVVIAGFLALSRMVHLQIRS
jgi:hypothetical protein